MTDREKVIKGLEQFKADFKPFCGNVSDWARVDNALALLKEQEPKRQEGEPTAHGWISVKDNRLPEHGKKYLICATSSDNKVGYITTAIFGGHFVLTGRRAYWRVTHWMPLPEPPRDEEVKREWV